MTKKPCRACEISMEPYEIDGVPLGVRLRLNRRPTRNGKRFGLEEIVSREEIASSRLDAIAERKALMRTRMSAACGACPKCGDTLFVEVTP
jgi:hypothetical protein